MVSSATLRDPRTALSRGYVLAGKAAEPVAGAAPEMPPVSAQDVMDLQRVGAMPTPQYAYDWSAGRSGQLAPASDAPSAQILFSLR